jgi:dihydrolipoamide dehydrogenase
MLGEPSVAMAMGATVEDLARTIHAHPSLYEGIYEAAKSIDNE